MIELKLSGFGINRETITALAVRYQKYLAGLAVLCFAGAAGGLYILVGPPGLLAYSESPEFCGSCHLHQKQYETWSRGAHRTNKCGDCHLPNGNLAEHFIWKGYDGAKDVTLFFTGNFSDDTVITGHGRKVAQANCARCHAQVVSNMDTSERNCWECHRGMTHKLAGAIK